MVTPCSATGAPTRTPSVDWKYDFNVSFFAKGPELPDIKKMSIARVMLAKITVIPTRSSDHRSCCWLGISPHTRAIDPILVERRIIADERQRVSNESSFREVGRK